METKTWLRKQIYSGSVDPEPRCSKGGPEDPDPRLPKVDPMIRSQVKIFNGPKRCQKHEIKTIVWDQESWLYGFGKLPYFSSVFSIFSSRPSLLNTYVNVAFQVSRDGRSVSSLLPALGTSGLLTVVMGARAIKSGKVRCFLLRRVKSNLVSVSHKDGWY